MSASKKYYWLKLKDGFFTDPKIKKLRRIAGGDTYTIILQKIMLLSIKDGGVIEYQGIEKTLHEELALILDEDVANVEVALSFMRSTGLIESLNDNEFLLPNVPELIGSESDSKERVRRFREKNKLLPSVTSNADVTDCNENVTTEKERRDKREEEEIDTIGINPIAISEWFAYKGSKYSKKGKVLSVNFLKKYDEATQLEIVRASIMNGWKGLFEPKGKKPAVNTHTDLSKKDYSAEWF